MTAFTEQQQIDEAYIPTEQDWEDVFADQFLFIGIQEGNCHPFPEVISVWAATAAEALATCQRLHPGFTIHRWDLADHLI